MIPGIVTALAVDASGNAYVTGNASGTFPNAPAGGVHSTGATAGDAFIAKINPSGTGLLYNTFLGSAGPTTGMGIALDVNGNVFVAGYTSDANLLTSPSAAQPTFGGGFQDGFVAKLLADGSNFSFVTYLGGSRFDSIEGIAVDPSGNAYVTGSTTSNNFPLASPLQSSLQNGGVSLFVTTDGGRSWTPFDTNIPGIVYSVSPDPSNANIILVSTDAGIFRTTDNGASWSLRAIASFPTVVPIPRAVATFLTRSPANPNVIYAVNAGFGFLKSTDDGVTWTIGSSTAQYGKISLIASPADQNIIYVWDGNSLRISSSGGLTWDSGPWYRPLQFSQGDITFGADGTVYVLFNGSSVLKSTGLGFIWNVAGTFASTFSYLYSIVGAPSNASVLYAQSAGTIYRTNDGGGNWTTTSPVPNGATYLAVDSANSSIVYAASLGVPVLYKSTDGGATWKPLGSGLGASALRKVVLDPSDSSRAFAIAAVTYSAFVAKLNNTGSVLDYSTFLSSPFTSVDVLYSLSPTDTTSKGSAIALAGPGEAIVAGTNQGSLLPARSLIEQKSAPATNAFVARISDATPPCAYSVTPGGQFLYGIGVVQIVQPQTVSYSIGAPTGCPWTASSDQPWAVIAGNASGTGLGSVQVQVGPNAAATNRSATVTIAGQAFTILQAGAACWSTLSAATAVAPAEGAQILVSVTTSAGCSWITESYQGVITTAFPDNPTLGSGTVRLNISPNPKDYPRTLVLSIAGHLFTITQGGTNPALTGCTSTLSSGGQAFTAAGGSGAVSITTNQACAWIVTSDSLWVSTSGLSGSGNGNITFQVGANSGGARSAVLTISGISFTIEQQAAFVAGLTFVSSVSHVAAEENWTTTFTLVNKSGASSTGRLSLYDDSGSPLNLPLNFPQRTSPGPVLGATLDRTLSANASLIIETAGPQTPPVQIGSAQLAATSNLDGFAIFHHVVTKQEAALPLKIPNASSYLLAFDNTNGVVLGVALQNVSAQPANIRVVIRDDAGTQIGVPGATISLAGNGHTSFVLSDPILGFPVTASKRGTIEFDTPPGGQISALGIRFTPPNNALTTITALANVGTGGGSIAHLASGGDGWQTTFVLVNVGNSAAQATLSFFADITGSPLPLPLSFPQPGNGTPTVASSFTRTLAAGATLLAVSSGSVDLLTGSAQLSTTGNVSGFVIFRHNDQEAVVPLESRNASGYVLAFDNTADLATAVAINSLSAQTVNIPVTVRDDAGTLIATDMISLAANGHYAFTMVVDRYLATAGIRGTLEFGKPANGQIGVLGIRIPAVAHTFTSLPALAK
jgi:photosystem II stability/assembly factor-like uncharacterized protein